ncbi:SDR family oxidoreductase [Undibacterium squillarum]|uniref:NAD(P)-dependent oxidoreductase n=1 Tax=Undibacterium squillarum TaxID=1131567 RepID=A0ABQ2XWL8_9BURK|nr:SDR family oxidoreductase [Undibacterium squillarum]GGX36082.1 NAD(P)-dependent oxidoreductase [Undibacterium squillarum]
MFAITGASGQLGRLVIAQLLKTVPASQLIAIVRKPSSVADLAVQGVQVRQADYNDSAAMQAALQGVQRLLLISSSEIGQREAQHRNVIQAAKAAGVQLIAYTSLLHADRSPLALAQEHVATEQILRDSGIAHAILRNGWYTENYLGSLPVVLQYGAVLGASGEGRISSASRADYAAAAAAVLQDANAGGKVLELAGDTSYSLSELAAEIAAQSGKPVQFQNMPTAAYQAALESFGLPAGFAALLADSDEGASKGGLFDDSHTLSQLIGRSTTTMAASVTEALAALPAA